MKHLIQTESAEEHGRIIESLFGAYKRVYLVRNYLLNHHESDIEQGVYNAMNDFPDYTKYYVLWALGVGVEVKKSLLIYEIVDREGTAVEVSIKSKVYPLGPAIYERRMPIDETIKRTVLGVYYSQLQEKRTETYELVGCKVVIEQQPNSFLTLEFVGEQAPYVMYGFMQAHPGLLYYRKPFNYYLMEFQSRMGISVQEQKQLNSLTFATAVNYRNYQSCNSFQTRLRNMAQSILEEFNLVCY